VGDLLKSNYLVDHGEGGKIILKWTLGNEENMNMDLRDISCKVTKQTELADDHVQRQVFFSAPRSVNGELVI
jgi:hypothetical protein